MKITYVKVGATFSTGNYENQRYDLGAELEEGENHAEVAEKLKVEVHKLADREDLYRERRALNREIDALHGNIEHARAEWERVRAFLVAQGINPNAPDFPIPVPAQWQLPAVESERTDVIDINEESFK